jgi:signal recognition particle subunit SRP54
MVLETLGNSLKDTFQKISRAVFVDEKLINELVRDIQRALLQSDVNVKMVFELTKQIKERLVKEETPAGLTKKEFLIKIVYEELVKFLGESESKIEIKKKPTKIMMVGLFGHGKCVHKDSNILLSDGTTITAEKLYEKHRPVGEFKIEDGHIIPLEQELYVPSLNTETLMIERRPVSYLWKLKSKKLIQVNFDHGNNFGVKTTCEHPFFVLNRGVLEQRRADELKAGEYVAIPSNVSYEGSSICLKERLRGLDILVRVENDAKIQRVRKLIKTRYGTLRDAVQALPSKHNYAAFTHILKKGQVPMMLYPLGHEEKLSLRSRQAQDFIDFPTRITPDLAEFVGYVIGDGYLSEESVHVSNADPEIIARVGELSRNIFGRDILLTPDKRTKSLQHIRINSITLVQLMHRLFGIPIGKKGRSLEVPALIQKASLGETARFIRAYFDCDGHFPPSQRQIEITSESSVLLKQTQHILLRFGIVGTLLKKQVKGKEYYRLTIQARDTTIFREKIGSLIKRKQDALDRYEIITIKQGDGKKDMIPVGGLLKKLRERTGLSINQIQKEVSSYGMYENKGIISRTQLKKVIQVYERTPRGNFAKIIGLVDNKEVRTLSEELKISRPLVNALVGEMKSKHLLAEVTNSPTKLVLTEKGRNYLNQMKEPSGHLISSLKSLAFADVCWLKVKGTTKVANNAPFVYDLTVECNHNFIADGCIVHNTTTTAKLAKYYTKRGFKVAVMSTDTWRPAAYEQLRQLGAQINVPVFGNPKVKDPVKVFKEFEPKLNEFDLVIIDTAGRDALSEELIEELNKINKAVNADERLLVIGADVGQAAERQAKTFHETCNVTGVIITKLEGTAKGGGALIACSVTGAKVKFIGLGEKIDDLDVYSPQRFVGKLLGMGDLEGLLEKAREAITEDEAKDLGDKLLKGDFNLLDLYSQMEAMNKMGPLGKVVEMIPGFGQLKMPKEALAVQEGKLKKWKYILNSCTKEELEEPEETIDASRIDRIAKGAGVSATDVRELLKQYKQSKKMVKSMKGLGGNPAQMEKMMKRMGGGKGMAGMGGKRMMMR